MRGRATLLSMSMAACAADADSAQALNASDRPPPPSMMPSTLAPPPSMMPSSFGDLPSLSELASFLMPTSDRTELQAAATADDPASPASAPDTIPAPAPDGWVQTWGDDFDVDGTVDPHKWVVREGDQHHTAVLSSASRTALDQKGGSLFVSALKTPDDPAFAYTTGFITTQGTFAQTYGKFEFRLRGDFAPGLWYAVWGRPWINPFPEIDVEFLAKNPTQAWFVNHWDKAPLPADQRRAFTTVNGNDLTAWHTYTVLWTPEAVDWSIDGTNYMHAEGKGVPHEPTFWTINAWVGGWGGKPEASTPFPSHFEVDYIHIYRPATWLTDPQIRIANPRPTYASGTAINLAIADFDPGSHVEVWEGESLLATMTAPPFNWKPTVEKGTHAFTFKATDGKRTATTTSDITID